MKTDPRIDAYIAKSAVFAQPILRHLRVVVHQIIGDAEETMKWSHPHFTVSGKNIAGMAAFKGHAGFTIHGDSGFEGLAKDGGMGQFGKLTSIAALPADTELAERLIAAERRVVETGSAMSKRPAKASPSKAEMPVPEDFARELSTKHAAKATLEAFAPSHRREYLEWVGEAKRAETREKRIAQAIEMLAEGKKRNWK